MADRPWVPSWSWIAVRYFQGKKGQGMPEVTIELLEGRTLEQKRGLVRDMTEAVVRNCGVQPEDVTIIIHDNLKSDKAKAGKLFADR
jgi:4-oxalocrotonate tautomerase